MRLAPLLGQNRNIVKVEYCFIAVLITMARRCITDVLNGDGVLTYGSVGDRITNETRKGSFYKMTVHCGNRTENQKVHYSYPCQINRILTLIEYYRVIKIKERR